MKKILFIFGTRPEAIKLAPLILFFKSKQFFKVKICITAQHREMLDEVLTFFKIKPDYDLNLMKKRQTLSDITALSIQKLKPILDGFAPDLVFVQGDTTTAFTGALAAFYNKVKVAHVEAGLRSFDNYSPFPEEVNRKLISNIADFHFTPTQVATNNLINEGHKDKSIYNVGNTVIDALFHGLKIIEKTKRETFDEYFKFIDKSKKIILVTAHRRENFGKPLINICNAIKQIAVNEEVEIVFPVHFNPNVREVVYEKLVEVNNIHLIDPLSYPKLIWLMNLAFMVLTDSGGIQEEAPSLKKPVLVMRNVTERTEGVDAGNAILVGSSTKKIVNFTNQILTDVDFYKKMIINKNPYGDGTTCNKIYEIICQNL